MFVFPSLRRVLRTLAFGIPTGITIYDVAGYIAKVEGNSMHPVLNPLNEKSAISSDYVFLYNWPFARNSFGSVDRGDIVVLISPSDPKKRIIKRIIGLPGDIIETKGFREAYIRIREGHCWIEGDHTGYSLDSNTFGPVALALIKSKAICIVWPPTRWQILSTNTTHIYNIMQYNR